MPAQEYKRNVTVTCLQVSFFKRHAENFFWQLEGLQETFFGRVRSRISGDGFKISRQRRQKLQDGPGVNVIKLCSFIADDEAK